MCDGRIDAHLLSGDDPILFHNSLIVQHSGGAVFMALLTPPGSFATYRSVPQAVYMSYPL